ncbi:unnamed protein product [Effrenium voratum]|nr:unnamed protein product [Effrenium voratum]
MSPAQLFARRGPLSYDQLARTGRPSGLRLGKLRTEDARRELEALRGQRLQLELGLSFFEAKARLGAVLAAAKLSAAKAATAKPRRFRRHRGSAMAEPLALPAAPCCRRLLHLAGKELGMDTEGEGFETLVNGLARVYTPGAGLPRHVDHEMFQEPVLAMVLQAAPGDGLRLCQAEHIIAEAGGGAPALRAVLRAEPGFRVQEEDGLLICLEKAARYDLAHEVPAVSSQRISLTWRWFRPEFLEQLQRMEMSEGQKLGLDVDYMAERSVLPILVISGGIAEQWNKQHPERKMNTGDSIVEVNGIRGNVALMLEKCKVDPTLEMTVCKCLTYGHLVADLEKLISIKGCGPIMIRLSWHDAGVHNGVDGCPNAAMRLAGGGEHAFGANAGLPQVAIPLLQAISDKYVPRLISHADLWALAANIAIKVMGGPDIVTHFGRYDVQAFSEGVSSAAGRLPETETKMPSIFGTSFAPRASRTATLWRSLVRTPWGGLPSRTLWL